MSNSRGRIYTSSVPHRSHSPLLTQEVQTELGATEFPANMSSHLSVLSPKSCSLGNKQAEIFRRPNRISAHV